MPQLPDNIRFLEKDELEMAALRVAIMAEFDCINTYEQILTLVKEGELKNELIRLLADDKAHAEVLQGMLSKRDVEEKKKPGREIPEIDEEHFMQ